MEFMRGKLVSLRSVLPQDSNQYYQWINDRELVLFNANFKSVSQAEHDAWFNSLSDHKTQFTFSIIENEASNLIGTCSLRNVSATHKNAELQIRIGERKFHDKGYGSDAVNLLVKYGFSQRHLKRIYLNVFTKNQRAIRAYEKCGFIHEGTQRKAAFINGEYIDVELMAIVNNDTWDK